MQSVNLQSTNQSTELLNVCDYAKGSQKSRNFHAAMKRIVRHDLLLLLELC